MSYNNYNSSAKPKHQIKFLTLSYQEPKPQPQRKMPIKVESQVKTKITKSKPKMEIMGIEVPFGEAKEVPDDLKLLYLLTIPVGLLTAELFGAVSPAIIVTKIMLNTLDKISNKRTTNEVTPIAKEQKTNDPMETTQTSIYEGLEEEEDRIEERAIAQKEEGKGFGSRIKKILNLPISIFKKLTNKKEEKVPVQKITQEAGLEIDEYIQEKQEKIKVKEKIAEKKSPAQKQISPTMKKIMERLSLEESGTELAKAEQLELMINETNTETVGNQAKFNQAKFT
jgi:hypothetical protein